VSPTSKPEKSIKHLREAASVGGLFRFTQSVQCRLLAQSGHSRHRNILSAIGQERTLASRCYRSLIKPPYRISEGPPRGGLSVCADVLPVGPMQRHGALHGRVEKELDMPLYLALNLDKNSHVAL
jgi:hypothetical protein